MKHATLLLVLLFLTSSLRAEDALRQLQNALRPSGTRQEKVTALAAVAQAAQEGRLAHKKAAKLLLSLMGNPATEDVQDALVTAIGRLDDTQAVQTLLLLSVDSADARAREIAVNLLGRNPGKTVQPALVKALRAKAWELRAQAALTLCERGAYGALDDLIEALDGEKHQAVLSALGEALERLTLVVLPVNHTRWKEWRDTNPDWQPAGDAAGGVDGSGGTGKGAAGETVVVTRGPQKPRAYGLVPRFENFEVEGDVVLLVVDVSGSMVRDGARSISDAQSLVRALPSHIEVMVLCFTETLQYADEYFAPLDVARKKKLDAFLESRRKGGGGTDFETALLAAIDRGKTWFESHPKDPRELDIVVFSDGESSSQGRVSRISPDRVRSELAKLTGRRVVRMSTIGSTGEVSSLMVELANLTGGHVVLGDRPLTDGLLR